MRTQWQDYAGRWWPLVCVLALISSVVSISVTWGYALQHICAPVAGVWGAFLGDLAVIRQGECPTSTILLSEAPASAAVPFVTVVVIPYVLLQAVVAAWLVLVFASLGLLVHRVIRHSLVMMSALCSGGDRTEELSVPEAQVGSIRWAAWPLQLRFGGYAFARRGPPSFLAV